MTIRYLIVPVIKVDNRRSPAHFGGRAFPPDTELVGVVWGMMDYGLIDVGLVAADVDATQVTYLETLSDVQLVPANIDNTIGTQARVDVVSAALEAFNIPATWVNVGDTYRTVMREIAGYFLFMQRITGITGVDPTTLGVNLSTRFNQLSTLWQNAILQAAADLNYSTTALTGTATLRQILRNIASQNGSRTFQIGGTSF